MTLKPGDLVMLKSGGPTMTVRLIVDNDHALVECQWFDGAEVRSSRFHVETLTEPAKPVDVQNSYRQIRNPYAP